MNTPARRRHATPRHAQRSPSAAGGSVTVELVLLTPVLLLVLLFIVTGARVASAKLRVSEAAATASRTASLTRTPADAVARAHAAARQALAGAGAACTHLTTITNTGDYRPGGLVAVTVTCTTSLTDLTLLHLPGTTHLTAHATSPIDRWRGQTLTGGTTGTPAQDPAPDPRSGSAP